MSKITRTSVGGALHFTVDNEQSALKLDDGFCLLCREKDIPVLKIYWPGCLGISFCKRCLNLIFDKKSFVWDLIVGGEA